MAIFKFGNVTIDSDSASADDFQQAAEQSGGAITGGHFGGEDHGISGGTFHGRIVVHSDGE
ncbi:hypothetical protein [Streptomyces sp. NBC_00987]|uniref:hypothetical protein n=1 Tax=Streptomyces sp. NBC_00987 TaxID=2903703 RepID=UPI00386DD8CC|nr:hypothetical protein OG355_33535 [Streptomyces sp. NBC_00987]